MTESEWTRGIIDEMKRCNTMVFAIVGGILQEPGWPDRHITHTVWQGFLEFKGVKTRLSPKQKIIIRELNARRPGSAYVVRQPDRIEDYDGNLISHFNGSGYGLLQILSLRSVQ